MDDREARILALARKHERYVEEIREIEEAERARKAPVPQKTALYTRCGLGPFWTQKQAAAALCVSVTAVNVHLRRPHSTLGGGAGRSRQFKRKPYKLVKVQVPNAG